MNLPHPLEEGDEVALVAPASRCSDDELLSIQSLLTSWGLKYQESLNLFGKDLLCSNRDEQRFESLKEALFNPKIKAIFCVRGGYGSTRLIPHLYALNPPQIPKWFIGISDITALHLFFNEKWQWPTIHAGIGLHRFSEASQKTLYDILFMKQNQFKLPCFPLNQAAEAIKVLQAALIGGNLSLVQCSLATPWQIQAKHKILFLEEINERGYQIDRMLVHLEQAQIFKHIRALLFGDFLGGTEADGSSRVQQVLKQFAEKHSFPVFSVPNVGHGNHSMPLPLFFPIQVKHSEQHDLFFSFQNENNLVK